MCNRLLGHAEMEIARIGRAGEDQVADQRADKDRRKAEDELGLLEEHEVTHTADHAEPRPLRQCADDEARCEADEDRRMQRAGTCARFAEVDERRGEQQQRKDHQRQDDEHAALRLRQIMTPLERVALVQEEHAREDAAHKAGQAQQRIEVAARQSQNHAERAAEEHQAAHHYKHAQHEARHRRAAAAGGEFLVADRHNKAAEHQTDDLRPDVLHGCRRMESKAARRVTQEARDAEAHVLRVPEQHQQRRDHADDQTSEDHIPLFMFQRHIFSTPFSRCFSFSLFENIAVCIVKYPLAKV